MYNRVLWHRAFRYGGRGILSEGFAVGGFCRRRCSLKCDIRVD